MPVKTKLRLGAVEVQHAALERHLRRASSGRSWPSRPTSPSASGMTIGSLSAVPASAAQSGRGRAGRSWRARRSCRRDHDFGRAGLRVPEHELREIAARYVGEALHELLDGRGLAVVALEVEVHALAETSAPSSVLQHAHDLGALLVDGRRVEVVDLVIELGPHRMGERAGILDELMRAQRAHVADALDRARAHVGGEFLVAKDRQAFLQAELEPVAAGDAVAGPVVEVFVRDDRLDMRIVGVGRGLGRGQHVLVVEDVEALVLHRAHVEVGDGDDHEDVEIVFAAERLLVPAHRALERSPWRRRSGPPCRARHRCAARPRGPDMVRKLSSTQASSPPTSANR